MEKLSAGRSLIRTYRRGRQCRKWSADFRGANGLWRGYRVEDVATPEAFAADPEMVWQFYSERRQRHQTVKPNWRTSLWQKSRARLATASFSALRTSIRCTSRRDRSGGPHAWPPDAVALFATTLRHRSLTMGTSIATGPRFPIAWKAAERWYVRISAGSAKCPFIWISSFSNWTARPLFLP